MIESFDHRWLKLYFTKSSLKGIPAQHEAKIRRILDLLNVATAPSDMRVPGFDFHAMKGDRKGTYAVTVTGNWRITFKFSGKNATRVNYEDYHK